MHSRPPRKPGEVRKEVISTVGTALVLVGLALLGVILLREAVPVWRAHGFTHAMPTPGEKPSPSAGLQAVFGGLLLVMALVGASALVRCRIAERRARWDAWDRGRFGSAARRRERARRAWFERHPEVEGAVRKVLGRLGIGATALALGLAAAMTLVLFGLFAVWLWTGIADWAAHGFAFERAPDEYYSTGAGVRTIVGAFGTLLFGVAIVANTALGVFLVREARKKRRDRVDDVSG